MLDLFGLRKTLFSHAISRQRPKWLLFAVQQGVAVINGARRDMGARTTPTANPPAQHADLKRWAASQLCGVLASDDSSRRPHRQAIEGENAFLAKDLYGSWILLGDFSSRSTCHLPIDRLQRAFLGQSLQHQCMGKLE